MTAYKRQLDRWEKGYVALGPAAEKKDHAAEGRILKRTFLDKTNIRSKFGAVPVDLTDGEKLYRLIIQTSDACEAWALVYQTDPPPYQSYRKGARLADHALACARALDRNFKAVGQPSPFGTKFGPAS